MSRAGGLTRVLEIPIFPLGSVLFPAGRLGLRIFEPRYVEMTRGCLRDDAPFGVTLIRAGFEVGVPAVPCEIGCTARIVKWDEPEPERFNLLARGESVFRILERRVEADGLIIGRVELADPPEPAGIPENYEPLVKLLRRVIDEVGAESFPAPQRFDDAAWVGNRLAELLPVLPERKQQWLELQQPLTMLAEVEQVLGQLRSGD